MTVSAPCSIHVIGIDDSGIACLAASECQLLAEAALICGGRRHLQLIPDSGAELFPIGGDLSALFEKLASSRERLTVVLASGDPCFYGIGPLLVDRFGPAAVLIHSHASSVAMAFARLGLAWQDATVLSVHGRPIDAIVDAARAASKVAILTDPEHTPAAVAEVLLRAGMPDCPAYVCERLGGQSERIHSLSLSMLTQQTFDPLNVLVLLPDTGPSLLPTLGARDSEYLTVNGQITKAEVRAVTVARLEPWNIRAGWDIGAGSGSVAIEAASLMTSGRMYAIERDPRQREALSRNVRSHRAHRVEVIDGEAPAALEDLPDPDAVFIGGSGGLLAPILEVCGSRLRPGGRLVANFTLLDSLEIWRQFTGRIAWPSDISQIAVSRAERLGEGTRLTPLGPVFVARAQRSEGGE